MLSLLLGVPGQQLLPTHTHEECLLAGSGRTIFWAEVIMCLLAFPSCTFCTAICNYAILFKEQHKERVNYYLGVEETVEWETNYAVALSNAIRKWKKI